MLIPIINNRFNTLPKPKYLRMIKTVTAREAINPRLELIRMIDKVKNSAKNTARKKSGNAPLSYGSTKYTIPKAPSQRRNVMIKVGRKFFRSLTSFFL
jgi:hypothetical protein